MLRILCRFFEKKLRKKLSCGKFLGVFKKSTLDGCCQSSGGFLLNYVIGVCGNNFNITNTEFGCRHCRPLLKKSSAKNFLAERFLWVFKKVRSTFISSTPKALFRQQIYTASVGERVDTTNGSLREVAKRRYGSE